MMRLEAILAHPVHSRRIYAGMSVFVALLLLLLLWPLIDLLVEQQTEIKAAEIQRTAQAALAGRTEKLLAEQAELTALDGLTADYLPGDSAAASSAALQGLLAQQVQAAGGQLLSTRPLPTEDPQISARLDALVSHGQLRSLLHALEGGQPRLIVTGMELQAAEGAESLTLSLVATGMRRLAGGEP